VVWTRTSSPSKEHENPPAPKHTEHFYWCCKGQCDRALRTQYYRNNIIDGWEDIPDLIIPIAYIRWVMVTMNQFYGGATYSDDAFKNQKTFLLNLFPLVCRDMTTKEKETIKNLSSIPNYMGGWHYDD
jgi:hypothetical protein